MKKIETTLPTRTSFIRNLYECDFIDYQTERYPVYIIDKSILLTCPEIIPTSQGWHVADDNLQVSCKHFVIPTSVILELEEQKQQEGLDSFTSKILLHRLHQLLVETKYQTEPGHYQDLVSGIYFPHTNTFFSVYYNLPNAEFDPLDSRFDLDQCKNQDEHQEIRTTQLITAVCKISRSLFNYSNKHLNGWQNSSHNPTYQIPEVTILTCNNLVTILARAQGVKTKPFSIKNRLYTGRRETIVPLVLYNEFLSAKDGIDYQTWQEYLPDEPPLTINEFISMTPRLESNIMDTTPLAYDQYRHIGRFDQKTNRIVHLSYYKNFGIRLKNEGQVMYAEAISHPGISVVFITGSAGTGKTFLSVLGAIKDRDLGQFLQATVVPCSIDVQRTLGFLPGDLNEKIEPNIAPIKNAIQNYIKLTDGKLNKSLEDTTINDKQRNLKDLQTKLRKIYDKYFKTIPVEAARGLDFSDMFVIYDEFQDQTPDQADMLLKRIAKNCKVVISGDIKQIHQHGLSKQNNGLSYAKQLCTGLPMVAQIELKDIEVVRSDFVQAIVERQG